MDRKAKLEILQRLDEETLTKEFLIPLFSEGMGYKNVQYTHGILEFGRDIIYCAKDEYDNSVYTGVQVKATKVTTRSTDTIIRQINSAFGQPFVDPSDGKKKDIDRVVLITSHEFTEGAKESLWSSLKPSNLHRVFTLIDGNHLVDLLDKYLPSAFLEVKNVLFFGYQDFFAEELNGKGLLDHQITLYGRKDEKESFQEFLESSERVLMVYGHGGIGKTRTLIEFARIAEKHGWSQAFIRAEEEAFDEHLAELLPNGRYVLFIDDVHRYDKFEKLLEFVISRESIKIKMVSSTRPVFHNDFKNEVLTRQYPSDFREMELLRLKDVDIINILKEMEVSEDEREIICKMSGGFPLITVLAVQLMRKGASLQEISHPRAMQSFFSKYINELRNNKGAPYVDLLKYLAFLVPMPIKNEEIHKQLGELLNVSEAKEQMMIQDLLKEKFIEMRAEKLRIVPDLLGEYLIHETCFNEDKAPTGFHRLIIEKFILLTPKQLITNLALTEATAGSRSLLDEFLDNLKREARDGDNLKKFAILEWLKNLSYLRPEDTLDIIKNMLRKEQESSEYIHQFWGRITIDHSDIRKNIPKLLKGVANFPDTFEEAIEILKDLSLKEGDEEIYWESAKEILLNVCSIQYYRDIRRVRGNQWEYRDIFRRKTLEKLKSWLFKNEFLDRVVLDIIERQLEETVDWSEKSLEKKGQINLRTWEIPEEKQLQEMRVEFFNVLFKIGSESPLASTRAEVPNLLSKVWREMNRRERIEKEKKEEGEKLIQEKERKKRREEEKERMLQFLIKRIKEETEWRVINSIIETFRYLRKWEEERYQREAEKILDRFEQDDMFQLYRVLAGNLKVEELKELNSFMREKAGYFSQVFTAEELKHLLNRILEENESISLRRRFFYELGVQSPDYALRTFELLQKTDSQAKTYSGYILGGLRVSNPRIATSVIEDLRNKKDMHTIVESYELLTSYENFNESDLNLLEEFIRTDDELLRVKICSILPNFQYVNTRRCLKILENASCQATPQFAETILSSLFQLTFSEADIQFYKSIIMNFLPLENIFGVKFGSIMNKITKYDPLFLVEFLEKRIEYKEANERDNENYKAVPFSFGVIENFSKEKQHLKNVLRRIRDWMEMGDLYAIKAPSVFWKVCNIRKNQTESETASAVKEVLQEWIEEGSHSKLRDVACLLLYSPSTEWVFELLERIIEKSDGNPEILSSVSAAIGTTSRAEIVSFGEISPQSLRQISFLEEMLNRSTNRHVRKFAESEIKEIKESAQRMKEMAEENW